MGPAVRLGRLKARRKIVRMGVQPPKLGPGVSQIDLAGAQGRVEALDLRLKPGDEPCAASDFAHVAGAVLRHGFEFLLDPPLLDRSLGAHLIALGKRLGHRQGHQHFEAARGQAHGPPPEGGQNQKRQEPAKQEAQREYQGLFDQGDYRVLSLQRMTRLRRKSKQAHVTVKYKP